VKNTKLSISIVSCYVKNCSTLQINSRHTSLCVCLLSKNVQSIRVHFQWHPCCQFDSTVASKKFWSSMSFQNLVRLSQIKKIPCLIMPMSTKCKKKIELLLKKMTINVVQHDDRLWYLRPFYNGPFSIGQSMTLTTSIFFLLAPVCWHHLLFQQFLNLAIYLDAPNWQIKIIIYRLWVSDKSKKCSLFRLPKVT
jgi:hypothetical protein